MALSSARSIEDHLPEGRPDIMGWPVVAGGDSRVGTVRDLFVDQDTRRLRYLEVDLDDREDTVLVPVGHARVDQQGHRVVLPGLQREVTVIIDEPQEVRLDINPGQRLRITGGTLRGPGYLGQIEGVPLTAETEALVREQSIYLVVDASNIPILEGGTRQTAPGMD
jgi:hypothetical protein